MFNSYSLLFFLIWTVASVAIWRWANRFSAHQYHVSGFQRSRKGDFDGALADDNKAIKLDPKCATAYYNRGLARSRKGDQNGAMADYNNAIKFDPGFVLHIIIVAICFE